MKKICFRVDANSEIGQGHMTRCLCLANEIARRGDAVCLFVASDERSLKLLKETNYDTYVLNIDYTDYSEKSFSQMISFIKEQRIDILVIDSYHNNNDYIKAMKAYTKVACFYCPETVIDADLIINYNINYNKAFYKKAYSNRSTILLLGSDYIPLRPEFCNHTPMINEEVSEVLLLTGGSDAYNVAGNFMSHIASAPEMKNIHFTIVKANYANFEDINPNNLPNVTVISSTPAISDYMKKSDIVISAGGTTMYELSALGIPSIIYSLAKNQTSESEYMGTIGCVRYAGRVIEKNFYPSLFNTLSELTDSYEKRLNLSKTAMSHISGHGCRKIVDSLFKH